MFHVAEGLFFERHDHIDMGGDAAIALDRFLKCPVPCPWFAGVRIIKTKDAKEPWTSFKAEEPGGETNIEFEQFIDASSWASVVASMCTLGENGTTFRVFEAFQKG